MFTDKRYHYYDISFYYDKIKIEDNRMKEVHINGDLNNVLRKLYEYRKNGEHVFCNYRGIKFDSDTVSEQAAALATINTSRFVLEDKHPTVQSRIIKNYLRECIDNDGMSEVTPELVVDGLKHLCENQYSSLEERVIGLIDLGCNFDHPMIKKSIQKMKQGKKLDEKTLDKISYCEYGASLLFRAVNFFEEWDMMRDSVFAYDGPESPYYTIRKLTGDYNYTMEYAVEKSNEKVEVKTR